MQRLGENFSNHRAVFRLHQERLVRRLIELVEHPKPFGHELQIVGLRRSRDLIELLDAFDDRRDFLRVRQPRRGNSARHTCKERAPRDCSIHNGLLITVSLVRAWISGQYSSEMPRMTFLAICASCGSPGLSRRAAGKLSLPRRTRRQPSRRDAEMPSDPYLAEVTKFRQDREATLKGNAGWLTIAGLWFLTQPQTTFGSDPLSDIVFPASAPPRAGTFELRNGKVTVKAAEGVTFQLDGKPVTTMRVEVRRARARRSAVARERSAVLGAQQRRASVDSPARSEQLRCERSSPA